MADSGNIIKNIWRIILHTKFSITKYIKKKKIEEHKGVHAS